MSAKTTLEQMLAHSVKLNGILIPIGSADSVLARYAECLFVHNDDPTFPVSLSGSAIALRYHGRYFLVCSRHQLRGKDLERVSILTRDGKHCYTSGGVRHFNEEINELDSHDIAIFDFTDPCEAIPTLRERFFNFVQIPPDAQSSEIVFIIVAGYPFDDQLYDLADNNQLGLGKRIVVCCPDSQPSDPTLLTLRPLEPLTFDPNGMSGGSAFTVQFVHGEPTAFFSGMIVRAGKDLIHIVKAGYVRNFLDQI